MEQYPVVSEFDLFPPNHHKPKTAVQQTTSPAKSKTVYYLHWAIRRLVITDFHPYELFQHLRLSPWNLTLDLTISLLLSLSQTCVSACSYSQDG